jgi:hypothetical protein
MTRVFPVFGDHLLVWNQATATSVAALAQVATAVVAVAAAIFAWRQVTEARRTRGAQAQPFVIVDIELGRVWMNWLTLVVENVGKTLAKDVRITFDPPLSTTVKDKDLTKSVLLREGISVLPPGRRIETLFDLSHDRLEQRLPMRYKISVSFRDYRNRQQESLPYVIDLTYLYDLEPLREKTTHDLVEEVSKLRGDLEKFHRTQGLLVRRPSDVRKSRNDSNWQYALTGKRPDLGRPGLPPGLGWPARVAFICEPWLWWRRRKDARVLARSRRS